jgi:hypothetical protein
MYLSIAMATVIKMDPLIATDCAGYKKYGNSSVCIELSSLKFRRKFSKIEPKRYQLSKPSRDINRRLKVFLISSLEGKSNQNSINTCTRQGAGGGGVFFLKFDIEF